VELTQEAQDRERKIRLEVQREMNNEEHEQQSRRRTLGIATDADGNALHAASQNRAARNANDQDYHVWLTQHASEQP
jgi:hypothetical protein